MEDVRRRCCVGFLDLSSCDMADDNGRFRHNFQLRRRFQAARVLSYIPGDMSIDNTTRHESAVVPMLEPRSFETRTATTPLRTALQTQIHIHTMIIPVFTHMCFNIYIYIYTNVRATINFNKALSMCRDIVVSHRTGCVLTWVGKGGSSTREGESNARVRHDSYIRSLRMHTSTLDCTLVPCNKIL